MPNIVHRKTPAREKQTKKHEHTEPEEKRTKRPTRAGRSRGLRHKLEQAALRRKQFKGAGRKRPRNRISIGRANIVTSSRNKGIHTELMGRAEKINWSNRKEAVIQINAIADEYLARVETGELEINLRDSYSKQYKRYDWEATDGIKSFKEFMQWEKKGLEKWVKTRGKIQLYDLIKLRLAERILGKLR